MEERLFQDSYDRECGNEGHCSIDYEVNLACDLPVDSLEPQVDEMVDRLYPTNIVILQERIQQIRE